MDMVKLNTVPETLYSQSDIDSSVNVCVWVSINIHMAKTNKNNVILPM